MTYTLLFGKRPGIMCPSQPDCFEKDGQLITFWGKQYSIGP
jgi:hypothetical protein